MKEEITMMLGHIDAIICACNKGLRKGQLLVRSTDNPDLLSGGLIMTKFLRKNIVNDINRITEFLHSIDDEDDKDALLNKLMLLDGVLKRIDKLIDRYQQ